MGIRGYIDLALIALILILLIVALWFWRLKDNASADLIAAQGVHQTDVAVHKDDLATIKSITTYDTANGKLMAKFIAVMSGIDLKFGALNTSISNLRRTNADVEKYLATPIPPALLCLLRGDSVCGKNPAASLAK